MGLIVCVKVWISLCEKNRFVSSANKTRSLKLTDVEIDIKKKQMRELLSPYSTYLRKNIDVKLPSLGSWIFFV